MLRMVQEAGLHERIHIDSAGTGGWHAGNKSDARMRKAAATRGLDLVHLARQVTTQDLAEFDLVLIMDEQNHRDLRPFDPAGRHGEKVRFFCEFCTEHDEKEVPDPYYGGSQGFEHVLDLLEDGCAGVLNHIRTRLS